MLERFKPLKKDQVRVPEESLRETVAAIFEEMGETPEAAAEGADVLVMTDLRGVETHGVSNMMRAYVEQYGSGHLNPRPDWRVIKESPGTATIDAGGGLGIILGRRGMELAVEKARGVGMGVVTMLMSGHLGAVGHFAMIAAEEDMVGVCITAGGAGVLPTFGAEPRLGANPISIAAPARNEPPVLFDVATSAIAGNKVSLAKRVGANLLPGWIADAEGNPIMEETPVPEPGQYAQLPLGSTREQGSHKGYGFSLMAEILGSLLAGSVPTMLDSVPRESMFKNFFAAYDIGAFTDVETFKDNMDQMLRGLRTTRPAPGHERVLYPGLSEHEEILKRRANGIPFHREVVEWFDGIAEELSVPRLRRM
ncbi:MAG: Ldh family oxidoreductase [Chloroflexi bacterium]|nr:Ldh family oxidoreductase [Chloroflexota bacterium]